MEASRWSLDPLSLADVSEPEARTGAQRRSSEDNVFQILPRFLIRPSHPAESPEIQEQALINSQKNGTSATAPRRVMAVMGNNDTLGIVLDHELLILEKDSELEVAHRVGFQFPIDFVLWRRSILLIGLSSSEIVLVDPRSFGIRESKRVSNAPPSGDRFFIDAAIHSTPDPTKIDMIAVGRTGDVYLFSNISLSDGTLDSTYDQNVSVDIDVGSIRGVRFKVLPSDHSFVTCASAVTRNTVVLGEANGTISLRGTQPGEPNELRFFQEFNLLDYLELRQVSLKKIVPCEGLLFVLLSNGKLEILLDDVLFPTQAFNLTDRSCIVHDFSVVLTRESEVKLWVIYNQENESAPSKFETFVGIFAGPSFHPEFTVRIPSTSADLNENDGETKFLFPLKSSPYEEPFAVLKVSGSGTKVYHMSETSTEATIQKLLTRGKFDQAVALAIQYGKDLDIVYKARARIRFIEVVSLNPTSSNKLARFFEDMTSTLEKIKDAAFICGFCCQAGIPELKWIKEILALGKSRVKDCSGTESGKKLLLTLKKFYTFEQVLPNGTIQDWVNFASEENTMFQQCKSFLNTYEFDKCERVWRRHFDEFIPSITLNDFGPFFFILFGQRLSTPEAVSLLKSIFPYAVEKCARGDSNEAISSCILLNEAQLQRVCGLMDIIKKQVFSLERERGWPSEAIEFVKIVITVAKEEIKVLESSREEPRILTQRLICKEILARVELLLQALAELTDLKQNHSIRIRFQQFIADDVIEVVNSLLYELYHKDEIERFINSFLVPFAKRKGIQMDRLFSEHIKAVVADLPYHASSIDIPHEERLICLITYITSLEVKLRSALKIAEEWPVPWSPRIDALIVNCLRMNAQGDSVCCDLQKIITIMRTQVPLRCLLNKYRLSASKVDSYCGVVMALTRIIKIGKPEFREDCMELLKHKGRADDVKIQSLEFSLNLRNSNFSVDNLVSPKWNKRLLKRLLARMFQEFRTGDLQMFNAVELQRITDVSKVLANILDDKKAIEFLKLREFIPGLDNCDIVYDEKYPFCVLNYIMTASSESSKLTVIEQCKKLSEITFTHFPDILIAAAAFYAQNESKAAFDKAMTIVKYIVSIPGVSLGRTSGSGIASLVQGAAEQVAQLLICNCPYALDEQLETLHEFLILMTSFDDNIEDVVKMLSSYRVFSALREQEIPQEKEFLTIHKWMYLEGIPFGPGDVFLNHLRGFGSTILKFGDKDLFLQAFGCIQKEFLARTMLLIGQKDQQAATRKVIKRIQELQALLLASYEKNAEPESNKEVIELIKDLKASGISVNPYALRQRNKSQLLEKLLKMSCFSLAAQVALVFEVYDDHGAWSKILNGFMNSGDDKELRKVLVNLRNISELWMLPEFAIGWRKVSEGEKGFEDLCPIPLD